MGATAVRGAIRARVLTVVKEVLAIENDTINLDASIAEELATKSLDRVALFMALEDEFGGTIPENEAQKIKTIRQIVDCIERRLETA